MCFNGKFSVILTRNEDFSQANEDVCRRLHGDVNMVGQRAGAVHASRAVARRSVTGSSAVDDVLHDRGVHQTERSQEETNGDTRDGLELDLHLAQDGVDDTVQNGNEHDDRDSCDIVSDA